MALEDDIMELMSMKQKEEATLQEFIKRFHRAVLDLGALNHPQALRGLKEGVKIGWLWYNLRSPVIHTYSAVYEQVKRDIEIKEENATRIKTNQLEGLRKKEKIALSGVGRLKGMTTMTQATVQEVESPLTTFIRGHHNISAAGRNLLVHQPGSLGEGMTRHIVIFIHTSLW